MLEKIDLDKVFNYAKRSGFQHCVIYGEVERQHSYRVQDKIEQVTLHCSHGISVHCEGSQIRRFYSTTEFDADALIAGIEESPRSHPHRAPPPPPEPVQEFNLPLGDIRSRTKPFWMGDAEITHANLELIHTLRNYEVCVDRNSLVKDADSHASLETRWCLKSDSTPRLHQFNLTMQSVEQILGHLQKFPLRAHTIARKILQKHPWPNPRGPLPIHWSSKALAKVLSPLLRSFEGDLVVENASLLTQLPLPLSFPFAIAEAKNDLANGFDQEGAPKQAITFFEQGRPRSLACDRRLGEQLSVPSTGHSRRQSFRHPPTVSLWHPEITPTIGSNHTLHTMEQGISIHDVSLTSSSPNQKTLRLMVTDALLLHQGEEGEAITPFALNLPIHDFLTNIEAFTPDKQTYGAFVNKNGQRLFTSVTCPGALTTKVGPPDGVPPSHYWQS